MTLEESWRNLGVISAARARPLFDRFIEKVNFTDTCWLWIGSTDVHGYGQIFIRETRKLRPAHIVAWFLEHQAWPSDGLRVCHHCDTPACIRPSHLFLGTQRDNMQDAKRKGRTKGGRSFWKINQPAEYRLL